MALTSKSRLAIGLALAGLVVVLGAIIVFVLTRPKPAPPAPPAPPPKWDCGTAYGKEICERGLPPARPAS